MVGSWVDVCVGPLAPVCHAVDGVAGSVGGAASDAVLGGLGSAFVSAANQVSATALAALDSTTRIDLTAAWFRQNVAVISDHREVWLTAGVATEPMPNPRDEGVAYLLRDAPTWPDRLVDLVGGSTRVEREVGDELCRSGPPTTAAVGDRSADSDPPQDEHSRCVGGIRAEDPGVRC